MWLKFSVVVLTSFVLFASAVPNKTFYKEGDLDTWTEFEPVNVTTSFRLHNNTRPIHYDIALSTSIHIPNFEFNGVVTIQIVALQNTSYIIVQYRDLDIGSIDFLSVDGEYLETNIPFELRPQWEFIVIYPKTPMVYMQQYKVRIYYRGVLRTFGAGFYRASYWDAANGVQKYLATTQFESTDARHAFPCYDEPQIRTSFSIIILHHPTYNAISNMPVKSTEIDPLTGYMLTTFEKIPSMQTYLVAFTVSDYISIENADVVPIQRVYARPSVIKNGEGALALKVSPELMSVFEIYTRVNYSLPKMDQIALLNFSAGAMENWGLIAYREIYLLYNPNTGRTADVDNIITIIAHEFAHQWFGNLICPEWWSYLWLNEGFATLYEYLMPHFAYPEDRYDDSFIIDNIQRVFETDSNPNIRPMTYYVEHPNSIDNLFDSVAYAKAGSVLYTFRSAFGEEIWRDAMTYYLNSRSYMSANSAHLYGAVQRRVTENNPSSPPDVALVMSTWELQAGFPLVTVSRNGDVLTISQERFFYDLNLRSDNVWWIPVNYATKTSPDYSRSSSEMWINGVRNMTVNRSNAPRQWAANDWMIFNIKQNFYYRVNYDSNLWSLIIQQLNAPNNGYRDIHYRNRGQLIGDAYHIARSGRLAFDTVFRLMEYLWQETDYFPWVAVNSASTNLNRWLTGSEVYADYQQFMKQNSEAFFTRLGVEYRENENRLDRYARTTAITIACRSQLQACLTATNVELTLHVASGKRIYPEYVSTIYCNGMRAANRLLFFQMQSLMLRSTIQTERNNIISGMSCTQNNDLLYTFLNLAVIPGIQLTATEKQRILTSPAPNGENALKTLIEFTWFNYNSIRSISSTLIGTICSNIASYVGSQAVYDEFTLLLQRLVSSGAITSGSYATYRSNARGNLNWQALNMQPIKVFFQGLNRTMDY